jgi:hypothetical protein
MIVDLFHDLIDGLGLDDLSAVVTIAIAELRKQQSQIVVDLRQRAYRTSGISDPFILFNGDGRREAAAVVYLWPFS